MPTDATDPEGLHRALRSLVRLQEYRDRQRAAGYGLSSAGADALDALANLGPISLNRLAAELFVDKSTACRVVALLEARGWLVRTADPHDGRALRLHLTPEGRALQTELHADASWETQAVLRSLPEVERGAAVGVLDAWTRVAANQAGVAAPGSSPTDSD
jgi:MarR family transcriptional regulator, lower aerobic nicotinate degradation pathway regulator